MKCVMNGKLSVTNGSMGDPVKPTPGTKTMEGKMPRFSRHFDLFIKFDDGTYHSSENPDMDSAIFRFNCLNDKHSILYAYLFDETDIIEGTGRDARCFNHQSIKTVLVG